mgnify:FL=1
MRPCSTFLLLLALAGCPSPETGSGASGGTSGGVEPLGTTEPPDPATSDPTTSGSAPATSDAPTSTTGDDTTSTTGASLTGDAPESSGTTGEPGTTGAVDDTTGPAPEPPWEPKGCPDIYKQDILPTFELEISPSVLADLEDEWESGDGSKPAHPLEQFKYDDTVITNASIELRGNKKWWPDQNKMQFEVAFNAYDKKGRFKGLKKVLFDAARYNESFLRDRLSLKIMRDVGLPAPCANNARLVVNGAYYGLFTSIEKVDSEFLERYFEAPNGNLYKRQDWAKKTNEEDKDESDVEALLDAKTIQQLDAVMNLDEAILEWAAEAVLPDNDGAWAGGLNYYVYNDPLTGFNVIPWDLDATFERIPFDVDPYTFLKENDWGRPFYTIATKDPEWFKKYIDAIAFVLAEGYDVPTLQGRIDAWAAQIADAAASDPNKPFSTKDHLDAVKTQRDYVAKRANFVKQWLVCWQSGGTKGENGKCNPP